MKSTDEALLSTHEDLRFHLSRLSKRKIYSAIITAMVMVLTVGQPHAGVLLIALILPLGIWLGYGGYVMALKPYARLAQAISIAIWLFAICLVLLIHLIRHDSARRDANEMVRAIAEFTTMQRGCTPKLEAILMHRPQLAKKLRADFRYDCEAGKPTFSYRATFTVFDTYEYDFKHHTWRYGNAE